MTKLQWSYKAGTLQVRRDGPLIWSWPAAADQGPWTALILNCLPIAGEAIVGKLPSSMTTANPPLV